MELEQHARTTIIEKNTSERPGTETFVSTTPQEQSFLSKDPESLRINVFDENNPYSLRNIMGEGTKIYQALQRVWEEDRRLLGYDLTTLRQRYRKEQKEVFTPAENRLRMQFWLEYDACCMEGRKIDTNRVLVGAGSRLWFETTVLPNNYLVAFMLSCPITYQASMLEALAFGLDQMRDILNMEVVNENGRKDTKLMELKAKIFLMLDQRINGGITQKQMHLHANGDRQQIAAAVQNNSMMQIEDKLQKLRERHAKLTGGALPHVIASPTATISVVRDDDTTLDP